MYNYVEAKFKAALIIYLIYQEYLCKGGIGQEKI
jgi:hypothetical protein